MGKIRVKTIGDESAEQQQKIEAKKRKEAKKAEKKSADSPVIKTEPTEDVIEVVTAEETVIESKNAATETSDEQNEQAKPKTSKYKEKKAGQKQSKHSSKYVDAKTKVDTDKTYKINEALELLSQVHLAKFDETVELHINTNDKGVSGSVTLPHGTGKKTRVAVANDDVIKDIEAGKIEFDILLAEPTMMPKLAKVARTLGPKGLMPNPKNGTVTQNPAEVAKKYEGGQVNFKSEAKSPILHVSIGKLSFDGKKLEENYGVMIKAVGEKNIKNITLKSTMSPAIRVQL